MVSMDMCMCCSNGQKSSAINQISCYLPFSSRHKPFFSIFILVAILVLLFFINQQHYEEMKMFRDSGFAMSWEGFGPERGVYNFTLVTAMLDIGRGTWEQQTRSYNTYLLHMQRVLRLDVNMVVFIDKKGKPFVDWMRRGRESRTYIVITKMSDLPFYRNRDRIEEIMHSEEYTRDNELVYKQLAESQYPEYDILQLSKMYFLNRAIEEDPFHNDNYMWMDGGYGHGREDLHPADGVFSPNRELFSNPDKMTFLERPPGVASVVNDKHRLHKISVNILVGGWFAGSKEVFKRYHKLVNEQMEEWMKRGIVDDDQTMNILLYFKHPSMFRLVKSDWYDVYKLFNSHHCSKK